MCTCGDAHTATIMPSFNSRHFPCSAPAPPHAAMPSSARAHATICAVGGTTPSFVPFSLPVAIHCSNVSNAPPQRTLALEPGGTSTVLFSRTICVATAAPGACALASAELFALEVSWAPVAGATGYYCDWEAVGAKCGGRARSSGRAVVARRAGRAVKVLLRRRRPRARRGLARRPHALCAQPRLY